jgi:putative ATP-dependent endonuclease of the OLD family
MIIEKIYIKNYKIFDEFNMNFNDDLNIIVGDNESGKSTLLEAINLAMTGILNGRNIFYEISPYIFNKNVVDKFIDNLQKGIKSPTPEIIIELYFKNIPELARLKGSMNSNREDIPGVQIKIEFNNEYVKEFIEFIKEPTKIRTIPTEYYICHWYSFAANPMSQKSISIKSSFIDTTTIRLQSGTDYYLQKIIGDNIEAKDRAGLTLAYRQLKETFADKDEIKEINKKLKLSKDVLFDKDLSISIDITQKSSWESNLTSYLDEIPFQNIGKGDQSILKILLALENKATESNIILIEEPENHLSFSTTSKLISKINDKCKGKQLIITTHNTFVLNKLGIEKVILLKENETLTFKELSENTYEYFKKLPGYDTLRMILSKKIILVEGPSDELFVQKAYKIKYNKLPIEDGIDVMSVRGLSFKRFLDIAKILPIHVYVITDNDGNFNDNVIEKYKEFEKVDDIKIYYSKDDTLLTLEYQIVACNDFDNLKKILGRKDLNKDDLINYMTSNKTECALKLFETEEKINIPEYIENAIEQK